MRCAPRAVIVSVIALGFLVNVAKPGQQPELQGNIAGSPGEDQLRQGYPTGEMLLAKVVEHNQRREANLEYYSESRHYCVRDKNDKVRAELDAIVEYHAPGSKQFRVISEDGSLIVRKLVFHGIMESETDASKGKSHRDSSITPSNYFLEVVGEEKVDGHRCFVAKATPRRKDKYLFEGKVWVDGRDFAIVKIEGTPAKNPSFWVKKVVIVRRYQKIGDFWLPLRDETVSQVRIVGKGTLTIDHQAYRIFSSHESRFHENERKPEPVPSAAQRSRDGLQ